MTDRREELTVNLARIERRITDACAAAGRDRDEVTLVAVTKTYPASDVMILSELGVRHVAENRDQDAAPKAAACAGAPLTWHFVGQLQTNKARSVVRYADFVHSVDRVRVVHSLSAAVMKSQRPDRELGCLVQVALDVGETADRDERGDERGDKRGEAGVRGGVAPNAVEGIAEVIAAAPGLRLDGVMTVAPLAGPYAGRPRNAFDRLMEISSRLRTAHPAANMVSAGMSADVEDAIAAGATHVRIGSGVLGVRPRLG